MIDGAAIPEAPPRKEIWGAWATAGFGLVVIVIFIVIQSLVVAAFIVNGVVANPALDIAGLADKLVTDGNLITAATIASAVVCGALILVIIKVRHGAKLTDYLALKSISFRSVVVMLAITIAFILLTSGVSILLKRQVDSDFISTAYESVTPLPLFWIAIVIFAPLFEEVFIRGFLFIGFVRSGLGPLGAVLLTALVWSALHVQYGLYEIAVIFALGIVLGIVRYRTGSLWCSVIIHSLNNLLAVFVVYLTVNGIID
jgi:membrane protease YdiL (CAAX protease family)